MTFKKTAIMLKYTLVIFKTLADYKYWRQGSKNWFAIFWKENEFKWSLFNTFWTHWYMLVCLVSSIPWLIYNLFTLTPHYSGPQLRWLGFDSKHFFCVFSKIQKYDDQTKICENAWLSSKRKLKIKTTVWKMFLNIFFYHASLGFLKNITLPHVDIQYCTVMVKCPWIQLYLTTLPYWTSSLIGHLDLVLAFV